MVAFFRVIIRCKILDSAFVVCSVRRHVVNAVNNKIILKNKLRIERVCLLFLNLLIILNIILETVVFKNIFSLKIKSINCKNKKTKMHGRLVGGAGGGGSGTAPLTLENSLWTSWHDTHLIPMLNPSNILDYFSERTNPFYDRTCNNEIIRMQRQNLQHLENMVGIEYILLHVQGPILYVIRKQHRYSPTEVSPLADYYIIAGIVYQAPDLSSVINSRLLTTVQHLQNALEEAMVYSRYQQNKGYSWDFSSNKALSDKSKSQAKKKEEKVREEPSSFFQRQRVDMLLHELSCKYPIPPVNTNYGLPNQQQQQQQTATSAVASVQGQSNGGAMNRIDDIKGEPMDSSPSSAMPSESSGGTIANMLDVIDMKPPPEKKMKLS